MRRAGSTGIFPVVSEVLSVFASGHLRCAPIVVKPATTSGQTSVFGLKSPGLVALKSARRTDGGGGDGVFLRESGAGWSFWRSAGWIWDKMTRFWPFFAHKPVSGVAGMGLQDCKRASGVAGMGLQDYKRASGAAGMGLQDCKGLPSRRERVCRTANGHPAWREWVCRTV